MGTRLGIDTPKIFVEISTGFHMVNLLETVLGDLVDECCFVIRPNMIDQFELLVKNKNSTYVIQETPTGMGDAIFESSEKFEKFDTILIIWGDQVGVNRETVKMVINKHHESGAYFSVPLVKVAYPYVHYIVEGGSTLTGISQKREGDFMPEDGLSDIGIFIMRSRGLEEYWVKYRNNFAILGGVTQEVNFLPFLPFLASQNQSFQVLSVQNEEESLGMNTLSDLNRFKKIFLKESE
jgi:bifunctional N-acetylglucosamine-1-phosphate-uridyltransferase/glucosamine-1-phosphate-acetyltransferase GlmU-like protein